LSLDDSLLSKDNGLLSKDNEAESKDGEVLSKDSGEETLLLAGKCKLLVRNRAICDGGGGGSNNRAKSGKIRNIF
jgi:hypothetical protein